mmetsp:Transcript_128809/g.372699  ORF Transcript_128809/g.372699 Transcript_128809/m.372699 type:complete len:228 (-) Transcript_128809:7-690(-)
MLLRRRPCLLHSTSHRRFHPRSRSHCAARLWSRTARTTRLAATTRTLTRKTGTRRSLSTPRIIHMRSRAAGSTSSCRARRASSRTSAAKSHGSLFRRRKRPSASTAASSRGAPRSSGCTFERSPSCRAACGSCTACSWRTVRRLPRMWRIGCARSACSRTCCRGTPGLRRTRRSASPQPSRSSSRRGSGSLRRGWGSRPRSASQGARCTPRSAAKVRAGTTSAASNG